MSHPGILLTVAIGAFAAAPASAAPSPATDGGALWTVVGMGAVILVAYVIARLATSPLLRRADREAVEAQDDAAQGPVVAPQSPTLTADPLAPVLAPAAAPSPITPSPVAGTESAGATAVLILQAGVIEVDPLRRVVVVDGERLDLTDTEYRLLVHLVDHSGQVLTRADLLRDVWGHKEAVYSRTVDTHIQRLRDKLGAARDQLETIRGAGYRLRDT